MMWKERKDEANNDDDVGGKNVCNTHEESLKLQHTLNEDT